MSELKVHTIYTPMDDVAHDEKGKILEGQEVYLKSEADKVIAELEESHKKEVERLQMKIAGLEKLVETADKIIKQKGGFTLKDVTFDGVKLEGMKNDRND